MQASGAQAFTPSTSLDFLGDSVASMLAQIPDSIKNIVSEENICQILAKGIRVREFMAVGLIMSILPRDSNESKILEAHGDNINKELGLPIDERARDLIRMLGQSLPTTQRKIYLGIVNYLKTLIANDMNNAIRISLAAKAESPENPAAGGSN